MGEATSYSEILAHFSPVGDRFCACSDVAIIIHLRVGPFQSGMIDHMQYYLVSIIIKI